eukprot:scaffold31478_cov101-Isochrysis_galbana.AAC.5
MTLKPGHSAASPPPKSPKPADIGGDAPMPAVPMIAGIPSRPRPDGVPLPAAKAVPKASSKTELDPGAGRVPGKSPATLASSPMPVSKLASNLPKAKFGESEQQVAGEYSAPKELLNAASNVGCEGGCAPGGAAPTSPIGAGESSPPSSAASDPRLAKKSVTSESTELPNEPLGPNPPVLPNAVSNRSAALDTLSSAVSGGPNLTPKSATSGPAWLMMPGSPLPVLVSTVSPHSASGVMTSPSAAALDSGVGETPDAGRVREREAAAFGGASDNAKLLSADESATMAFSL